MDIEEQTKTVWTHQDGLLEVVEVTQKLFHPHYEGKSWTHFQLVGPYGVPINDFRTKGGAIARAIRIARRVKASWREI